VVVDKNFQGQKIGVKIMKYLLEIAKNRGCYKTILDCTDEVKPFYEKLGFKHAANELRFDHF
jgi:glucosamine-phosphate N-acetyltransferase